MITFIIGGSGSGKSEYAESILDLFYGNKYYIATMEILDNEMKKKVIRHKKNRKHKNFYTIECQRDLDSIEIKSESAVILECVTNLAANELFNNESNEEKAFTKIKRGIKKICKASSEIVIVSGDIFDDGIEYDNETVKYMRLMGRLNSFISSISDNVVEVVYSIPIYHKKGGKVIC